MDPTRLVRGYATVMCVVALHDLEAGTINAVVRLCFETGSRMLDEGLHKVALGDATAFQLARRYVRENQGAFFQLLNGGLPKGGGDPNRVVPGSVHSLPVMEENDCVSGVLFDNGEVWSGYRKPYYGPPGA